jgi:hypothetical protein
MHDEHVKPPGCTIRVHGDVPQKAIDGLVAAIPMRTVIVEAESQVCGLNRKALKAAIEWQAQEWVEELMIHDMARPSDEPVKSCFAAIVDPGKLAEVVAELLRGFGFLIVENGDDPGDDMRLPAAEVFVENGTVAMHVYKTWNDCQGEPLVTSLAMPTARAFVLALLNAPTAFAQDVERMIQEAAT